MVCPNFGCERRRRDSTRPADRDATARRLKLVIVYLDNFRWWDIRFNWFHE